MVLIHLPDDSNICGARGGEFEVRRVGVGHCRGLKIAKSCS